MSSLFAEFTVDGWSKDMRPADGESAGDGGGRERVYNRWPWGLAAPGEMMGRR